MTMTISEYILATKGHPSGFDYLRLVLAVSVIVMHTMTVCYGVDALTAIFMTPARPVLFVVVPAFFAISGFLVAASFQRVNNIPVFLALRALRILPALLCVVLISTFLLGPVLTDLPLGAYVTDQMTRLYCWGAFGFVQYFLPGMFSHHPDATVNASLWTIPWEMKCYLLLPVIGMTTLLSRPRVMGVATLALNVVAYIWSHHLGHLEAWDKPGGSFLISCFFWGVVLYINRHEIFYSRWICAGATVVAYISILWSPEMAYLAPLPIAYASIYLGLQNPGRISLIKGRDLSYGTYLYGWPVQQTILDLMPYGGIWYFNLVMSLVVTTFVAWLSWTFVESRALARKRQVARLIDDACRPFRQLWRKLSERIFPAPEARTRSSASASWTRSGRDAA
jgi:peptidoglycan/LPS O-acetylase OafA/YrhL